MPGAKIQPNNPANDPDLKPVKGHSQFKPNYSLYKTHTFGLIEPHYAAEAVPDDNKFEYRSGADIDTLNLKAPMMTPMRMSKDTFFVPLRAILPFNADLLVTNPLTGDDIEPKAVNAVMGWNGMSGFVYWLGQFLTRFGTASVGQESGSITIDSHRKFVTSLLYRTCEAYLLLSPIFSYGSLAQSLGYNFAADFHGYRRVDNGEFLDFDQTLEVNFSYLKSVLRSFEVVIREYKIEAQGSSPTAYDYTRTVSMVSDSDVLDNNRQPVITFRTFLELLSQGAFALKYTITDDDLVNSGSSETALPFDELGLSSDVAFTTLNQWFASITSLDDVKYFNIHRLVAYQLLCASFYTDDAVDYIYEAKLWHQNMRSLAIAAYGSVQDARLFYVLNGVRMEYDAVSGYVAQVAISSVFQAYAPWYVSSGAIVDSDTYTTAGSTDGISSNTFFALQYYYNLFGYQRSLRYRDYFVGSRKSPLAVGDVTVDVNSNQVDVVDITKNIQMQRFLNQVNRVGRRIREYSAGIFGTAPRKETTEPIYLSHVEVNIGAEETSNTGAAQMTQEQTITSRLRKSGSNFVFSSDFNEYGVVIGVTYFDVTRPYVDGLDRTILHLDRFDMFNPYLQHIGDQPVSTMEIAPMRDDTFGYKLRYSEYKQRTDRVAGGFKSFLPGFAFPVSIVDLFNPLSDQPSVLELSPDFIRSKPHEFDKFFNSITRYSPAGYFHFIIRHDNEVSIMRPMEAAPSIL